MKRRALHFLEEELEALRRADLLRERPAPLPGGALAYDSNDYLGLATETGPRGGLSGAGASRLVSGERLSHVALEHDLARWLRTDAALLFSSGYAVNVGAIAALARPGDRIVSDALNHASIIDGCRLSRAEVVVVPHLDLNAMADALAKPGARRTWVVTESYFGMDADAPDLAALRNLCDERGAALYVDEAHALGVLGPDGRGLCAAAGVVPDVLVGTLGKSFGHAGAFAVGSTTLVQWLWNRARSFVFSTGVSPALAESARHALATASAEPWRRERVLSLAASLRRALSEAGVRVPGFGHVLPIVAGEPATALRWSRELRARGVPLQAIRPPTVPTGTARLRLTVTARYDASALDRLTSALLAVCAPTTAPEGA